MSKISLARGLVGLVSLGLSLAVFAAGGAGGDIQYADPNKHFHPKGKPPSEHTLKILNEARESMPFEDTRDFDEARACVFHSDIIIIVIIRAWSHHETPPSPSPPSRVLLLLYSSSKSLLPFSELSSSSSSSS